MTQTKSSSSVRVRRTPKSLAEAWLKECGNKTHAAESGEYTAPISQLGEVRVLVDEQDEEREESGLFVYLID